MTTEALKILSYPLNWFSFPVGLAFFLAELIFLFPQIKATS